MGIGIPLARQSGAVMTQEQFNERERSRVVPLLITVGILMIFFGGGCAQLNEPMEPIVIEYTNRSVVRWGNRFGPIEYVAYPPHPKTKESMQIITLPSGTMYRILSVDGVEGRKWVSIEMGWLEVNELPADAYRRFFEARIILEEHRRRKADTPPLSKSSAALFLFKF